jgi:hypothetical protein
MKVDQPLAFSVGLIQKTHDDRLLLLLRRHPNLQQWKFVCGERIENESFRETIAREVAWQLALDRQRDFLVANVPQLSVESIENFPGSELELPVAVEFYCIHLYGRAAVAKVEQNTELKWFSCAEVCDGVAQDGLLIDPAIVGWLNKWQVVQPWR